VKVKASLVFSETLKITILIIGAKKPLKKRGGTEKPYE